MPWLGSTLTLSLLPGGGCSRVQAEEGRLLCAAPPDGVPAVITRWYQRQARELLTQRLGQHASRIGRPVPPLRLSDARTRWGSLSARGVVSLNWRLVKADWREIDYVICHELAHFRQRDHSPAFWREVATLFPAWETARRELRDNTWRYFQF